MKVEVLHHRSMRPHSSLLVLNGLTPFLFSLNGESSLSHAPQRGRELAKTDRLVLAERGGIRCDVYGVAVYEKRGFCDRDRVQWRAC